MLSFVKTLFDLPREVRSASTWLVLLLALFWADAYCIGRFERSLVSLLQVEPAQILAIVGPRWLAETLWATIAAVATWFYVLPTVVVPLWRWSLFIVRRWLPDWMLDETWPSQDQGWHQVRKMRRRAIAEKNSLLLAACEERRSVAEHREQGLRCVLGILIFATTAWLAANDATGASLLGKCFDRVARLHWLWSIPLTPVTMPALALTWAVLVDRGQQFDDYICLPDMTRSFG